MSSRRITCSDSPSVSFVELINCLCDEFGGAGALAKRVGVPSRMISDWVDAKTPTLRMLARVARVFELDLVELCSMAGIRIAESRHRDQLLMKARLDELVLAFGSRRATIKAMGIRPDTFDAWHSGSRRSYPKVVARAFTAAHEALNCPTPVGAPRPDTQRVFFVVQPPESPEARVSRVARTKLATMQLPDAPAKGLFPKMIFDLVDGDLVGFADRIGCSPGSVLGWILGLNVPYVRTLVWMADELDVDLEELLAAAGKPPSAAARRALSEKRHDSLAMLLATWRRDRGMTTIEAAAALGIERFQYSRLMGGNHRLTTQRDTFRLAAAFGLDPFELARTEGSNELADEVAAATSGVRGMIRAAVVAAGLDVFCEDHVALAAKRATMTLNRFSALLKGSADLQFVDAVRLNIGFDLDVAELLCAAGVDEALAARWAAAAAVPSRRLKCESFGELVRSYRLVADMTQTELAVAVGYTNPSTISTTESGENVPSIDRMALFADVLGCPLDRLVDAAGMSRSRLAAAK